MGKNEQRFNINTKLTIDKIIRRIEGSDGGDNELIIPEYQRDYVWNEKINIPQFLSSLYIGYPIGFIIVWDNHVEDQHQLIDGLQRHYSIYKINEKPYNFLHYDMLKYWMSKKELTINEKDDKENFRHFSSLLHHKKKGYKKTSKDEIIRWINNTTRLTEEHRKMYNEFINDYELWFNDSFKKIIIPHIILKEFTIDEVAKIFELINSTGKKLNKFDVLSARWSQHKIVLTDKSVKFIKDFQEKRINNYKSAFENQDSIGDKFIKYDDKEIIPSNFIYAIFDEVMKDNNKLKFSFYDKKDKLQNKAIEAVSEIIKEALISLYDLKDFEMEELGLHLSKNITTSNKVYELVDKIKKAIIKLLESIKYLNFAASNESNKNIKYPSWLISAFLIMIIKGSTPKEQENYKRWLIYEMIIENNYSSGTGSKARSIIKSKIYNKKLNEVKGFSDKNLAEKIIELLDANKLISDKKTEINSKIKLILALASFDFYKPANSYQIDHLIPQSILKKIKGIDYNFIYNLQYIDSIENNKKGNELTEEQIKWDILIKTIKSKGYEYKYNDLMKYISKNISKDDFDSSYLENFLDIRKNIFLEGINSLQWLD